MNLKLISSAIIAISLSAPVMADDSLLSNQNSLMQMLLKYDTNGDGIISRDEMLAGKSAEFNAADINTDTFLSWDEYKTMSENNEIARITTLYKIMDADKDSAVTATEFAAAFPDKSAAEAATVFKLLAGDDASLSVVELSAAYLESAGKIIWKFASLDKDADGQISLAEYTELPQFKTPTVTTKPTQPAPKQPEMKKPEPPKQPVRR